MGMFSWLTCDTKQSVVNYNSPDFDGEKPVFLLQPNGQEPLKEYEYEGYGDFCNVDAYEWLAKTNYPNIVFDDSYELRSFGIFISFPTLMSKDGETMFVRDSISKYINQVWDGTVQSFKSYEDFLVVDGVSSTLNMHVEAGRLIKALPLGEIKYPIKLSYNPKAVYEDYPGSESCPRQGFSRK